MQPADTLFDLLATQPNGDGKRHGGGRYAEIIFQRMADRKVPFAAFYDSRLWLNPETAETCRRAGIPLYDLAELSLDDIVAGTGAKRLFSALPERICHVRGCTVLGTIHGLRRIETPFDAVLRYHYAPRPILFDLIKRFRRELSGSRREKQRRLMADMLQAPNFRFVTVSDHSKYSILSQFPALSPENVMVFYSPSTFKRGTERKPAKPYFLMVSGNRPDKNNLRAVMALDRLFSAGFFPGHEAVLTGIDSPGEHPERIGRHRIANPHRFRFLPYVGDAELSDLYANAFALLYPSLNEGFGYPPLEAMGHGIPVLASATASIPEVLGGAPLYFNPFSVEEIMNRLAMLTDPSLLADLKDRSLRRFAEVKSRQDRDLDAIIDHLLSLP